MKIAKARMGVNGRETFYYHNGVQKVPSVVLLHGKNSTFETWVDVGTMKALANAGHSAVSLSLPGGNFGAAAYNTPVVPEVSG